MKRTLFAILAGVLTLSACNSTSAPAPTSVSTVASTPASSSAPVSAPVSSAPVSSPSVSVSSTVAATPAPAPACVQPSRTTVSYTIVGSNVNIRVDGKLCKPLYVRVQNWQSTVPGQAFPQKAVQSTDITVLHNMSFTLAKLRSQQDIYASLRNDLRYTVPSGLASALTMQPKFLSAYASGPTPWRVAK